MNLLLRSMLFVPAYNRKFIDKALKSEADAIIIDMEDSVPPDWKGKARLIILECVRKRIFQGHVVFIRTNPLDDSQFMEDIRLAENSDITGFMPPKILSEADLLFLDRILTQQEQEMQIASGHFKLAPLVETTASVLNLAEIVRHSKRTVAICFGGEDYLNDLQGIHGTPPKAFIVPRALVAMAARSVGIAPIDTPFLDLTDKKGFIEEKEEAYELGFAGTLLINPKQIEVANQCFMPDETEVEQAKRVIDAIEKSRSCGAGCVMLDDRMIGPPMQRKAEQIMKVVALVEAKEKIGGA